MKFRNLVANGHRGDDPRPADGRGGADGRLRQDRAGPADGGGQRRQARHTTDRRPADDVALRRRSGGACTHCRKFWTKFRAGEIGKAEIEAVEGRLVTTSGTCAVMGTASTMAAIAEALGMILPGTAAIPAVHADRLRAAEATGVRAVELARSDPTPGNTITQGAVDNAVRVLLALGGSTNGVIHLAAIAGRLG